MNTRELLRYFYWFYQSLRHAKEVARIKELKGSEDGGCCFVLLTGAQINQIDLMRFKQAHTIACNYFFVHPDYPRLDVNDYVIVDSYREVQRKHQLVQVHDSPLVPSPDYYAALASVTGPNTRLFFNAAARKPLQEKRLFLENEIYYSLGRPLREDDEIDPNSLEGRSNLGGGALYYSVALAAYLGFKEIYLLGSGFTTLPSVQPHFYDSPDSMITSAKKPDVPPAKTHYALRRMAEQWGLRILNVVPEGHTSPVFEATSLENAYQKASLTS